MQTEFDLPEAKKILQKVTEFSLPIIASIISKRLTGYTVEQLNEILPDDMEIDKKITEGKVSSLVGKAAKTALDEHFKTKNSISHFKENMKKLLEQIKNEHNKKIPMFIFVDELDRCRPNYAIELLENIKHLFDIEGVYFLIATDSKQLSHSINAVYGMNFASEKYLKRFFDLEYTLKTPDSYDFVYYLFEQYNLISYDKFFVPIRQPDYAERNINVVAFDLMAQFFKLVPRDIEQVVSMLSTICLTWNEEHKIHLMYMTFLIMIKQKSNTGFQSYMSTFNNQNISKDLGLDSTINVAYPYYDVHGNTQKFIRLYTIIEMYSKLENITIKGFFEEHDRYHDYDHPMKEIIYRLIYDEKNLRGLDPSHLLICSINTYKDKILHCGQFNS